MRRILKIIILLSVASVLGTSLGCSQNRKDNKTGDIEDGVKKNLLQLVKTPVLVGSSDIYNVMDFGAVGDGKSDDTTAIKEAITYVSSVGGGIIYFPVGTYKLNEKLDINADGIENITLAGQPDRLNQTIIQSGATVDGDMITVSRPNVSLSYIIFKNNSKDGSVIKLRSEKCVITECKFLQSNIANKKTAVIVSGSENYIGNCYFGPGSTNGFIVNFTKEPGITAKNNTIADSYFGGDLPNSILINSNDGDNCQQNVTVTRNVFLFPAIGEVFINAVDGCNILNNMLDCATTAILLNPTSGGIKNVVISYNWMGSRNTDIKGFEDRTDRPGGVVTDITGGGEITDITISDNYFWGYYGIRITSQKFSKFTILNNYFVESNGGSIDIKYSQNNRIEGNIVASGAGADYSFYIGEIDKATVIKNNVIHGAYSIPDIESYKKDNFFE